MSDRETQMAALKQGRDALAAQFLNHPEVSLIDIGKDPQNTAPQALLVLRVHVRSAAAQTSIGLPEQINGVPVRTMVADYQLD